MKALPLTPEFAAMARRVIWFEEPEQALADPVRFVTYAMTYGLPGDKKTLREYYSDDELREALDHAPPGIFDGRSWAYWGPQARTHPGPAAAGTPVSLRSGTAPVITWSMLTRLLDRVASRGVVSS